MSTMVLPYDPVKPFLERQLIFSELAVGTSEWLIKIVEVAPSTRKEVGVT